MLSEYRNAELWRELKQNMNMVSFTIELQYPELHLVRNRAHCFFDTGQPSICKNFAPVFCYADQVNLQVCHTVPLFSELACHQHFLPLYWMQDNFIISE